MFTIVHKILVVFCLDDDEYKYISDFCKDLGVDVYIKHHDIDNSIVVGYDTIHCIIYLFAHLINYKLHSVHNSNYNTIDGGITFSEHLNNYKLSNNNNDDINYRLFEQLAYAAGCICACNHCL